MGEGDKVGADDSVRSSLEKGKKNMSAPKIAQSNRGRELRAAAALARFEKQQQEEKVEGVVGIDDNTGDDTEYDEEDDRMVDVGGGRCLIPVSGEEDGEIEQDQLRRELLGLVEACGPGITTPLVQYRADLNEARVKGGRVIANQKGEKATSENGPVNGSKEPIYDSLQILSASLGKPESLPTGFSRSPTKFNVSDDPILLEPKTQATLLSPIQLSASKTICSACTTANDPDAITCMVCANVVAPEKIKNSWRCPCSKGTQYLNSEDSGVCGICERRKPK
jgi:DNA-dependent metalloprotease WSS1